MSFQDAVFRREDMSKSEELDRVVDYLTMSKLARAIFDGTEANACRIRERGHCDVEISVSPEYTEAAREAVERVRPFTYKFTVTDRL